MHSQPSKTQDGFSTRCLKIIKSTLLEFIWLKYFNKMFGSTSLLMILCPPSKIKMEIEYLSLSIFAKSQKGNNLCKYGPFSLKKLMLTIMPIISLFTLVILLIFLKKLLAHRANSLNTHQLSRKWRK